VAVKEASCRTFALIIRAMADSEGKHVFVSYVREDSDRVDALCKVLEAAQIPRWRDRSALGRATPWKAAIRQAKRVSPR